MRYRQIVSSAVVLGFSVTATAIAGNASAVLGSSSAAPCKKLACPSPTEEPTPAAGSGCSYPAQVLDLTNWKLTLPIGSSGGPTEIKQPQLALYSLAPYFAVNSACSGAAFQAPTDGVTTSGTTYPRSELREMTLDGTQTSSWSSGSGTHVMRWTEAITAVPWGKKQIVAGQIHDATIDVVTVRLNYPKLFIDHNGSGGATLNANYVLGTPFSVEWVVANNQVETFYNGKLVETYTNSDSGLYFKAGVYTQSNCATELQRGYTCGPLDYGQVVVYKLGVSHS